VSGLILSTDGTRYRDCANWTGAFLNNFSYIFIGFAFTPSLAPYGERGGVGGESRKEEIQEKEEVEEVLLVMLVRSTSEAAIRFSQ